MLQWCEYTGMWARYCKRACVCIHGRVQALGFLYGIAMRPWGFGRRPMSGNADVSLSSALLPGSSVGYHHAWDSVVPFPCPPFVA